MKYKYRTFLLVSACFHSRCTSLCVPLPSSFSSFSPSSPPRRPRPPVARLPSNRPPVDKAAAETWPAALRGSLPLGRYCTWRQPAARRGVGRGPAASSASDPGRVWVGWSRTEPCPRRRTNRSGTLYASRLIFKRFSPDFPAASL